MLNKVKTVIISDCTCIKHDHVIVKLMHVLTCRRERYSEKQ